MKALSAAEAAKSNPKPKQENPKGHDNGQSAGLITDPQKYVTYGQMIPSRLGGRSKEVSFGPLPGGLVAKDSPTATL
jgi:hypothetical protein